jgi:hypothetical protein
MSGVGHDWTFALRHENQGAGAFCLWHDVSWVKA